MLFIVGDITDLAVSSNNALVASASNGYSIRVWRLPDGFPISVLRGHIGAVTAIAFSPRPSSMYQMTEEIIRLNGIYKWLLSNAGVKLYEGEGKIVGPNEVEVTQLDGTKICYSAKHILIATGSRAYQPAIPGQGRAIENSMEFDSSPSWALQFQGPFGGDVPLPLFSTAASSGFATSTIATSSAAVYQPWFPTTTIPHNHYFPSVIDSNNISQYYCRS